MQSINNGVSEENNSLTVIDNRTGKKYLFPIIDGHYIQASHFQQIRGPLDHSDDEDEMDADGEDSVESGGTSRSNPTHECQAEGLRIYDPAFMNTAVTRSAISFVDGERGVLLYRGYRIEDLLAHSNYLEVAYLLVYGSLPTKPQYDDWKQQVMTHTMVHVRLNALMQSFNYDAHPMGMFISTVSAMSTFHPEANPALSGSEIFMKSSKLGNKQIKRIIGKATTVAANAYRHRIGRCFNLPHSQLGYTENFLYMLDCLEDPTYRPHPVLVDALDKLFIIHAEHEMNCSTAAMMHIASSKVDPYSAVAGAASALYGPSHGGANEAVLRMLEGIGSVDNVPSFIAKVKAKEALLMGFGHRIYKHYDPRAKLVRDILYRVFEVCGREPLLEVAVALEQAALADDYFIRRRLYPNVDFYSGLIYKAMGFPTDFFPVLFAIPRIAGWLAHWKEQLEEHAEGGMKIWRPRQIYVGPGPTEYVPIEKRSSPEGCTKAASDSQSLYKRYSISMKSQQ
jgi:citrate synthase